MYQVTYKCRYVGELTLEDIFVIDIHIKGG